MRLIDKCDLTSFECSRVECVDDNFIVVTLGPYQNLRTRNRDFSRIIKNWRVKKNKDYSVRPTTKQPSQNRTCYWSFLMIILKRFKWRLFNC